MSKTIIKVEDLGKKYSIGERQKFYTLRDSITGIFDFNKKREPTNDFWALRDINFEVKQGESVGIIGRNGAGKSTLLKILSQITPPTTGKITLHGRVASLLEVGTGFHQELTGRENIFLNGAILGMSRAEIKRKFDEIVAFSEVEKFLDMPVKHYSSGMYMRLAFAVAAHLESEILIVDEVLAVGDAQFQKKCLGKMDEVAKKEGRTVLFVSHNMGAISQLCGNTICLSGGIIKSAGKTSVVVHDYLAQDQNVSEDRVSHGKDMFINNINSFLDEEQSTIFTTQDRIRIKANISINKYVNDSLLSVSIKNSEMKKIFTEQYFFKKSMNLSTAELSFEIANNFLVPGDYYIDAVLHVPNIKFIDQIENQKLFNIIDGGTEFFMYGDKDYGVVITDFDWHIKKHI